VPLCHSIRALLLLKHRNGLIIKYLQTSLMNFVAYNTFSTQITEKIRNNAIKQPQEDNSITLMMPFVCLYRQLTERHQDIWNGLASLSPFLHSFNRLHRYGYADRRGHSPHIGKSVTTLDAINRSQARIKSYPKRNAQGKNNISPEHTRFLRRQIYTTPKGYTPVRFTTSAIEAPKL